MKTTSQASALLLAVDGNRCPGCGCTRGMPLAACAASGVLCGCHGEAAIALARHHNEQSPSLEPNQRSTRSRPVYATGDIYIYGARLRSVAETLTMGMARSQRYDTSRGLCKPSDHVDAIEFASRHMPDELYRQHIESRQYRDSPVNTATKQPPVVEAWCASWRSALERSEIVNRMITAFCKAAGGRCDVPRDERGAISLTAPRCPTELLVQLDRRFIHSGPAKDLRAGLAAMRRLLPNQVELIYVPDPDIDIGFDDMTIERLLSCETTEAENTRRRTVTVLVDMGVDAAWVVRMKEKLGRGPRPLTGPAWGTIVAELRALRYEAGDVVLVFEERADAARLDQHEDAWERWVDFICATAVTFLDAYRGLYCARCGNHFAACGPREPCECIEAVQPAVAPGQFWLLDERIELVRNVDDDVMDTMRVAPGMGRVFRRPTKDLAHGRCVGTLFGKVGTGEPVFLGMVMTQLHQLVTVREVVDCGVKMLNPKLLVPCQDRSFILQGNGYSRPRACRGFSPIWLPWVPGEASPESLVPPIQCPKCSDGTHANYDRQCSRFHKGDPDQRFFFRCSRGHVTRFEREKFLPDLETERLKREVAEIAEAALAKAAQPPAPVVEKSGPWAPSLTPSPLANRGDAVDRIERLAARHSGTALGPALRAFVPLLRAAGELPSFQVFGGDALEAILALDVLADPLGSETRDAVIKSLVEELERDFGSEQQRLREALAQRGTPR